jgi:subtilisin family serine protease
LRFLAIAAIGIAANVSSALAADDIASRYVVRFEEQPLALYAASERQQGRVAIPSRRQANGRERLDVRSPEAKAYIGYLQAQQNKHFSDIAATLGRFPFRAYAMQHAVNAEIMELSASEAQRLARVAGVAAVEPEHELALQTDIAPAFIGAESVWWGTRAAPDSLSAQGFETAGYRGDGVVIGDIDTGYNSLSPSFAAADVNGYAIRNPLGHNHFIGQCNVPGISLGGCNDKVIGVYDELGLTSGLSAPVYTVEDQLGHGSHTASTAAGNARSATLSGYTAKISGIAPHANLVIYRVCSPYISCSFLAILSAIDHSIADGVVDALNFSISGGTCPWHDSVSLAFLSAAEAGIFVSAAGGNTNINAPNQVPGTVNHFEPWVATVASASHTGGALTKVAPIMRTPAHADVLAATSLLGPAPFDVIKPDLQAPGLSILAAIASDGTANGPNLVGLRDGTSMATPHVTGSAALLVGLHPDWTPFEVKSALMMSAHEAGLTKSDGVTPSDYFDRGSGRLQDFEASNAGLVLDETAQEFSKADPQIGGDPSMLNLASMQKAACTKSCSFSRYFHSTQNDTVTWTASVVEGPNPGFSSVTVSPTKFSVAGHAYSSAVVITASTTALASDGKFHFAEIVLTPDDSRLGPLHLPLAVAVP